MWRGSLGRVGGGAIGGWRGARGEEEGGGEGDGEVGVDAVVKEELVVVDGVEEEGEDEETGGEEEELGEFGVEGAVDPVGVFEGGEARAGEVGDEEGGEGPEEHEGVGEG